MFAAFKLGILMEGTWARACAGQASLEMGRRLHASTVKLIGKAHRMVEG